MGYKNATLQFPKEMGRGWKFNNRVGYVDFTVGAESSNTILVTAQMRRANQIDNPEGYIPATVYLFEDTSFTPSSYVISTTGATTYSLSVTTGALIDPFADNLMIKVISDSDGTIAITVTDDSAAGTDTLYGGFEIQGEMYLSGAVTFA